MRVPPVIVLCAIALAACDQFNPQPAPVPFARITVTTAPLPVEEDGTAPDLYVEVQDAGGAAVYHGDVVEEADASAFPYTVATDGALAGERRTYYVIVLDRDADGFDYVGRAGPFTGDDLRAAHGALTLSDENRQGVVEAVITL